MGLLLVVLVGLAYANSLNSPFTYDDYNDVLENTSIRHLWPLWDVFRIQGQGFLTRPVANLTFALDYALGGPKPFWFHLTNLLIHMTAALALFGLLRRTLLLSVFKGRFLQTASTLALVIAGLWALHPLNTEAVAYITQRYESLASMFMLLSLYALMRGTASSRPWRWNLLSVLACVGALGSKEVAVSLPLLVLLYDRTFLAGTFRDAWRARRPVYLGLLLTWVAFGYLQAHPIPRPFAGFGLDTPWWRYALNQPAVILHYLRLAVWPHPLVFDYYWHVVTKWQPLLPGLVILGAVLVFTVWALFKRPVLAFPPLVFLAILAPTSSFMPILDLAVEHRMYLPLAPVLVVLVLVIHALWLRIQKRSPVLQKGLRVLLAAGLALITTTLGALTYLRNEDYRDPMDLWRSVTLAVPSNPRGHNNYAFNLALAGYQKAALEEYEKAIALAPGMALFHNNYGLTLAKLGQYQKSLNQMKLAVELDPTTPKYVSNMGFTLLMKGDVEEAESCFEKVRRMDPKDDFALAGLASVLQAKHESAKALEKLRQAVALDPYNPGYWWQMSQILLDMGHSDEARAAFRENIRLEPNAQRVSDLAWTMHLRGQDGEALRALKQALTTKPGDDKSTIRVAWIMATSPDDALRNGPEAVRLAGLALRTQPVRSPELLDVLAVALAEAGRFPEARATLQEALAASQGRPAAYQANLQTQLASFQKNLPWRDMPKAQPQAAPADASSMRSSERPPS